MIKNFFKNRDWFVAAGAWTVIAMLLLCSGILLDACNKNRYDYENCLRATSDGEACLEMFFPEEARANQQWLDKVRDHKMKKAEQR